jgi:hypothetical protein
VKRWGGMACWQAALIALALTACDSPPPSVVDLPGVDYVHPKRRTEADVARASEAFYAKETHGQDVVFRSVEHEQAGYYFYTKLDIDPPADARLVLEVVRKEATAPERYVFSTKVRPQFPVGEYVIGLTGKDAGSPQWVPIAWRLSVVDAQGKVLASTHSFLWGSPTDFGQK